VNTLLVNKSAANPVAGSPWKLREYKGYVLGWSLSPQEIEIIENAQRFAWLYDGQMPLYIWLQSAVFNTFGPTLLSLTMMKNALMLMICLSIYTLVQRVSNTTYALATTLSLVFIPQLVWTSQHSLTTPVLATLFAATTLLAFSRLSVEKSVPRYGILGAMIVVPDLANVNPLHWDIFVDRARGMYSALQTALTFSSLLDESIHIATASVSCGTCFSALSLSRYEHTYAP